MNKEKILGFDVCTDKEEEILNNIFIDYLNNEQLFIVNINPEIAVTNFKNNELKDVFNREKYQIPDGSGIVWASKKQKGNVRERIAGIDFMLKICDKSQEYKSKIYLYGSNKGIAGKAKTELEKLYPDINIVGTCNGYCEEQRVIKEIIDLQPDIVFVGLGCPKQEEFIIRHKVELKSVKIFMPVGGSFDVISKTKKRAPNWIIKIKLEWLYRLFQEPKRIFRQAKLIKFMYMIIKK